MQNQSYQAPPPPAAAAGQSFPQGTYSATPPLPPPARGPRWSHSFWDCCSPMETCFCGFCAPCCLHGKTQSRLNDPALKEHSYANGDCCLYALLSYCGLHWVLLMLKRGELRERFEIEGSTGQDCAEAYFCPCCTLVQNEKEVEKRSASVRTQTQTQTPYQAPGGMVYSK